METSLIVHGVTKIKVHKTRYASSIHKNGFFDVLNIQIVADNLAGNAKEILDLYLYVSSGDDGNTIKHISDILTITE